MICIQAALSGDFTVIEVSVSVSAEEFVLLLNKIMLGLSSDNINIDFEIYSLFITYYIEGEISEYHIAQLNRLKMKILYQSLRHFDSVLKHPSFPTVPWWLQRLLPLSLIS